MFDDVTQIRLLHYVYRLVDPRDGSTFYVGEGERNRVFDHEKEARKCPKKKTRKLQKIREIWADHKEVHKVIHRYGLDEATAQEVEAALIEAFNEITPGGLTNIQNGHHDDDRGAISVEYAQNRFGVNEIADLDGIKYLLFKIGNSFKFDMTHEQAMDCARHAWRIDVEKARQAEYVIAACHGIIVGVFVVNKWLPATQDNFPGKTAHEGRYGFNGESAPEEVKSRLIFKRVPECWLTSSNAFRYINYDKD